MTSDDDELRSRARDLSDIDAATLARARAGFAYAYAEALKGGQL